MYERLLQLRLNGAHGCHGLLILVEEPGELGCLK
jgi:hypothetical protein